MMMVREVHIQILQSQAAGYKQHAVHVTEVEHGHYYNIGRRTDRNELCKTEIDPYKSYEYDPFIVLPEDYLQPLADALAAINIATPNQHTLEGTLAAQSAHLADLRRLVFEIDTTDKIDKTEEA